MPLAYSEHYTVQDFQQWEGNWELVEGVAYAMVPSPSVTHQRISGNIYTQIQESLGECPQCEALIEIDWTISNDTVVKPDVIVICYEPEETITKKPEIIFEVISPSTARRDEQLKFELYQNEGVNYYVLVYPEQKTAKVYRLKEGRYIKVGDYLKETCNLRLINCRIELDFSKIWPEK